MKVLLLILGAILSLANTARAETLWTLVDVLLVDDYSSTLNTAVYRNKEDCRSAAIKEFMKATAMSADIRVHENGLVDHSDHSLLEAILLFGEGDFSGSGGLYYIRCNPTNPIQ